MVRTLLRVAASTAKMLFHVQKCTLSTHFRLLSCTTCILRNPFLGTHLYIILRAHHLHEKRDFSWI